MWKYDQVLGLKFIHSIRYVITGWSLVITTALCSSVFSIHLPWLAVFTMIGESSWNMKNIDQIACFAWSITMWTTHGIGLSPWWHNMALSSVLLLWWLTDLVTMVLSIISDGLKEDRIQILKNYFEFKFWRMIVSPESHYLQHCGATGAYSN